MDRGRKENQKGLGRREASTLQSNSTLISISTDGSVPEWNTKKGFAVNTLMQLERMLYLVFLKQLKFDFLKSPKLKELRYYRKCTCGMRFVAQLSLTLEGVYAATLKRG